MDSLNQCLNYSYKYWKTVRQLSKSSGPSVPCPPPKSMPKNSLKSPLAIMVPGSQDILSQRICSFKTIIKQHFAYWVVNNVSFHPENKDFTWKPNSAEEMHVYIYAISLRGKDVLAKTIYMNIKPNSNHLEMSESSGRSPWQCKLRQASI